MKHMTIISAALVALLLGAQTAQAACKVEYKAKRDNPLKLFHEVTQVDGDCSVAAVTQKLQKKLAQKGLTLLKVLSVKKQ